MDAQHDLLALEHCYQLVESRKTAKRSRHYSYRDIATFYGIVVLKIFQHEACEERKTERTT